MVTIKDVAKKAQVSTTTVSRILNADNSLKVSSETRSKVLEIAEQLQYTKTNTVSKPSYGTIAITHWYTKELSMTDLYFRAIRWGVETSLKQSGYSIKRYYFNEELPDFSTIDGLVAIGHYDSSQLKQLKELGKPLVVINQNTLKEGISCVSADYGQAVREIIHYFLEHGHKKIGLLSVSHSHSEIDPRELEFIKEMNKHHLLNEDYIFRGDFTMESGYNAMKEAIQFLGDDLPTAFFIISDSMSIGAIRALNEKGIAIPERVSLIGFGDLEIGNYMSPSLSTINLAAREMGMSGASTLLNLLAGTQTRHTHLITSTQFIHRETTLGQNRD